MFWNMSSSQLLRLSLFWSWWKQQSRNKYFQRKHIQILVWFWIRVLILDSPGGKMAWNACHVWCVLCVRFHSLFMRFHAWCILGCGYGSMPPYRVHLLACLVGGSQGKQLPAAGACCSVGGVLINPRVVKWRERPGEGGRDRGSIHIHFFFI